jgi:hypothetical protein
LLANAVIVPLRLVLAGRLSSAAARPPNFREPIDMQPSANAQAQHPGDAQGPAPDVRGMVDNITHDRLYGWVHDAANPGSRLKVDLKLDGKILASTFADLPRPDLAQNGIGDGCHAFEFPLTPQQMARLAAFTLVATTSSGMSFPVEMKARQLAAPALAAGGASPQQVEARRLREEVIALSQRVQALPDAKAVRAVLDQHAAVTQQFQQGLQAMDQRLAQLPDANLLRQVMQQQGLLAERLEALEVWLTRLERRLAEAPPAPAATPASQVDGLQFLLFGGLGLAVLIAVIVGLLLRFG